MERPNEKREAAGAVAGAAERPYTRLGDGEREPMTDAAGAAIRGLDRKLTDGLNLVHGELAVIRDDFRELRNEMREGQKELRAEIHREAARAEKRADRTDDRITELAGLIRGLAAKVSTMEERSSGTRRLVWGVLGGLSLLLLGGALRPLVERAAAQLFGG